MMSDEESFGVVLDSSLITHHVAYGSVVSASRAYSSALKTATAPWLASAKLCETIG